MIHWILVLLPRPTQTDGEALCIHILYILGKGAPSCPKGGSGIRVQGSGFRDRRVGVLE
jgi:hypothetical protein